jgi:zinc protease
MKLKSFSLAVGIFGFVFAQNAKAIQISFEAQSKLPIVYLNVFIDGGAVSDPKDKEGLTSFMGQMLLRGTEKRDKEALDLILDQMGATLSADTRQEALILSAAVLSSELDSFLSLLREILTEPAFNDEEVRKLRQETVSLILQRLSDDRSLARFHFDRIAFPGHPYGRSISGTRTSVLSFTKQDVVEHYNQVVRSNRIIVLGTGDASENRIRSWAGELSRIRPGGDAPRGVTSPPSQNKKQVVIIDKPNRTQSQIIIGHNGIRPTHDDYFPLYVANQAFGGSSMTTRLMSELREKQGWTYGAYSFFSHGSKPKFWQVSYAPSNQDTEASLQYALQMIEDLRKKGITESEFELAQSSLINGDGFRFNTPEKRMDLKITERILRLPDGFLQTYGDEVSKVRNPMVQKVLTQFIQPENLLILVLGTASEIKEGVAKATGVSKDEIKVIPYDSE